jgi:hypothetical protein
MKNVFLSAAASGGLNEPLLSTQALDRANMDPDLDPSIIKQK